jgi:hypothetical protein
MPMIIPNELNYTPQGAIPNGTQTLDINVAPQSSTYSLAAGGIIHFDLPSRDGFIVPDTMNIRYKYILTNATESKMRCTPVYSPFQKLETVLGGTLAEIIPDYNVIQNMLVNCTQNVAVKYGNPNYGSRTDNDQVANLETQDGRHCEINEVGSFSAPLPNIISSCAKFYPIGATGSGTRISLTLDTLSNVFCPAAGAIAADAVNFVLAAAGTTVPTDMTLTDIVLSYTMVMTPPEATNEILGKGPITIKSQSFTSSVNNIPLGTAGSFDLIYSHKLASLKSIFMLCSSSVGVNNRYDAYDILGTAGDIQFGIAGRAVPARALSTSVGNKTMLMSSLRAAMGSIYDKNNSFSINNGEFFKTLAQGSTAVSPAKCYIACNTELIPSNQFMLSGTSTQESAITCRMNITTATTASVSAMLVSAFDVIIEIDPATKTVVVRK